MKSKKLTTRVLLISVLSALLATTTACVDNSELNTNSANYETEWRRVDVIAGEGGEFEPGEKVTVSGRMVGSVESGETVIWEQTGGTPVDVDDWTASPLTFTAPDVDGIENFTFRITGLDAQGNVLEREVEDDEGNTTTEPMRAEVTVTIFDPKTLITYEVEDTAVATLDGVNLTSEGQDQYISGAVGTHTRDFTPGNSALFTLDTAALENLNAGFYSLYARYAIPASGYGSKGTVVTVNGVPYEFMVPATGSWDNYRVAVVSIEEGVNTIEIGGGWNYYRLDSISFIPAAPPAGPTAVSAKLVTPEPSAEAQSLMAFLSQNYGSKTLTGQTEFFDYGTSDFQLSEFNKIVAATGGPAPAIVGFDFMDYSASRVACGQNPGTLTEDMIAEHNERNIILSALWHWSAPMHLLDDDCSSNVDGEAWWHGFYSTATTFDLAAALADTESDEYQALLTDIDTIAAELQKFEDAGIPILWRPLHEAEGAWFWWGNAGPQALKDLWELMFQRMTVDHGLNNLIWVFTHAGDLSADWYPGDEYVDIVGYDGYDGNNRENPFSSQYSTLKDRFNGKKLVALTETGTIPSVEAMHSAEAWWSFFITWNSGSEYGPDNASSADIKATYEYENVLNLIDVPGGPRKVGAGVYESFERSLSPWGAQINWSNTDGLGYSSAWSQGGEYSLSLTKDLSVETDPGNVVFQAYPADGVDLSSANSLSVRVRAVNAGEATTARLLIKPPTADGDISSDPVLVGQVATVSMDISQWESTPGVVVVFESFDPAATAAEFYIDDVSLDGAPIYDFEVPEANGWHSQINWSNTSGQFIAQSWASEGGRSLALQKDLSAENETPNVAVLQIYPADGIDVSAVSTISLDAFTQDSGTETTARLMVKESGTNDEFDTAQVVVTSAAELSLDVSTLDALAGIVVAFENFDVTSTDAKFYFDNLRFDGALQYGFEGTAGWEFQVNWSQAPGIQLSSDWSAQGALSLAAGAQIPESESAVFQTYPADGITLNEEITTLRITAYAQEAGDNLTARIFWKAPDDVQSWPDPVPVPVEGVELSIPITVDHLTGFGVQFESIGAEPAKFYIDNVIFEGPAGE